MGIEIVIVGIVWFIIVTGVTYYIAKYLEKFDSSDDFIRKDEGLIDDFYH